MTFSRALELLHKGLWVAAAVSSGILLVALIVWAFVSGLPGVVNRVALPDGRHLLLGIGPHPSDVVYELWQSVDPWGVLWRPTNSDLSWSEDGAHTADPALVVDPKGRWLLVRRGGLWTDCLDLHANLRGCESRTEAPPWEDPEAWEKRSGRIERLVGLPPTAAR